MDFFFPCLVDVATDPIKQYIVTPIIRHVGYAFKCSSKVQTLQDEVEQLKDQKDKLQESVDSAKRNGEEIYLKVTEWLNTADKDIEEVEKLVQRKEDAKMKCFAGLCPNLKTRYQLSKIAEKKASAIVKLRNKEGLDPISFRPQLQQIIEPSVYSREVLPSRVSMLNQIMDALRDSNLNMIGVYGMGGVGKSTLVKEVQGKAVAEKSLFGAVIVIAVSQTPDLRKIQAQIADFLGLKYDVEELPGRASQLYKRLEKSKVLIILDDLWQKLDLYAIGIPSGNQFKSCKIVLTSRSMDLLSSEMGAQKLFSLEALEEKETLSLFEMSVAEAKDPRFHTIAAKIAEKCAGLPLLIQLVTTELQNQEYPVWNAKLNQLSTFRNEEIYEKVYKVLETSYESLPGNEAKSFFLLCAMFGQSNIRIQYLLTHSMGLGLFRHVPTVEDARDEVFTLIKRLKAKNLLLDGDMVGYVKIHDVVRNMALAIASRVQHAFIGSSGVRSNDWPNKDCTRISLPYFDIRELPVGLDCPEAEFFLLFTADLRLEIPDSFFEGIRNLKVVNFTGTRLVSLPSSIGLLTNLQTLCLHRCRLDDAGILGELNQLKVLSFANSKIVELPREIEALTQLKLLDLRNCSNLKVIHENVLSKLCSLEELYMLNSFVRWNAKGYASLVELDNLSHLSTLEIQIVNSKLIPQSCMFFHELRSYKISIGDEWGYWWGENDERSKTLKLKLDAGIHLVDGIKVLMEGAEVLYLSKGRGVESVVYGLDRKGFPQLKHLHVQNDDIGIQHLIRSTSWDSWVAFPILESLYLDNMMSLENLCYGQHDVRSFGKLQSIHISGCGKLKSLFSFSTLKCLSQLQEMEVVSCENIEAIVGEGSEDEHINNEVIEFTQLNFLKLEKLPHLKDFCKRKEGTAPTELLFNGMVSFPNLLSLEVSNCKSLKYVFTASMMKCLMELKRLDISDCELVEEIMQSKKDEEIEQESIDVILFPNLEYLQLRKLPNVKTFSCGYSVEFPLLRELEISYCGAMKNFVSRLSSNESEEEYLFSKMVIFSNLEAMVVQDMNFKYIWDGQFTADDDSFSKLKSLKIKECSKLSVVFPSNACRRFQRLESLHIRSCDGVDQIYEYQGIDFKEVNNVEAFSLRDLKIQSLPSLKNIWSNDPCGAFTFENLQSVHVNSCEDLKYVFPASMACGLLHLQKLKISKCGVELIIEKEKDERSDASFKFPKLKKLKLVGLNEIRGLYEGRGSNIFVGKFIGNLEELRIDAQGFNAIQQQSGEFPVECLSKLKKITLENLKEESSIPVVFGILRRLKSLEMVVFNKCSLDEILLELENERPIEDQEQLHHLITLKHLELRIVSTLEHIIMRKKDSQFNHILQHLHTLHVNWCSDLINIAPSSASFQNLTTLHVENCRGIRTLVTGSTAKTMVQLVEMKVVRCSFIEEIVADDGDSTDHDVIIFKKLKRLELDDLSGLNSFCSNSYTFDFPLLEQVTIKKCRRMNIFCAGDVTTPKLPGILFEKEQQWEGNLNTTIACQIREWVGEHVEEGRVLQNVESLDVVQDAFASKAILANQMEFLDKLRKITVGDCESVQVVFDLEGLSAEDDGHGWLLPELNELKLVSLPLLSQLCNKAPVGILDFKKLKSLEIVNCSRLEYAFTRSMASCLFHLQKIEVKYCEMMETLIKEEDAVAQVHIGSLESIVVECLPKFSSIYSGRGDIECPSLQKISIRECPAFKSFVSRLTREDTEGKELHNRIHFSRKVFPKLEELTLDINSITAILQVELPTNFFSTVKKLELGYYSGTTNSHVPLLLPFLSRLTNVAELGVCNSSLEELFKFEGLNSDVEEAMITLPRIRSLKLEKLDGLKRIWWQIPQLHASFSQYLETVEVFFCVNLINFAEGPASFQNLTTLSVYGCNELRNLMTSSVAKSMVQLEMLTVEFCKMLTEIVADRDEGTAEEIVFPKVKLLQLTLLHSLESFSLGCYTFIFPCLEQVLLVNCPNMRMFCPGNISTPMLNCVRQYEWMEEDCYWEGNLNSTIEHIYKKMLAFGYLRDAKLSTYPTLKENWSGQLPFDKFVLLERLVVDDCTIISNAISSNLLQYLEELKVLIVEKCDLVEQVFDLEGIDAIDFGSKQMKNLNELHLIDLPKLTRVWNKDPQQILSFKNLQFLKVHNCGSLTFVFDLSTASSLLNLQHLDVKNCSLVEHIVAHGEGEKMHKDQTIFPSLQFVNLQYLTNLLSFYSASGFLDFSSLKMIVVECPNMELFASSFANGQGSCMFAEEKEEPISNEIMFLGNNIATPGLEELKVEWNSFKAILYGNNQPEFLHRLKCIELTGFEGEEYAVLPSNFLEHLPKLEKLALSDASIEEVNLHEFSILKGGDAESVALLTKLKLLNLPKLKHLVHDDSELVPLFQNLEDLQVVECSRLTNLVPSTVAFQSLTNLEVSKCDGMIYLMTASTARSLVQLRRINVKHCKMMQEIVTISTDGVEYEFRFSQLEYLELDDLPCLTRFCPRDSDFIFPSFKKMVIAGCPNLQ